MSISASKYEMSELFIKRLVLYSKSVEEIKQSLIDKFGSKKEDILEANYYFVLHSLTHNLFFRNEDLMKPFLFEAMYWASNKQTKKKIRISNLDDIEKNKNDDFYTKLETLLYVSIAKEYKDKEFLLPIKIGDYARAFYELSCIQRDKRKKRLFK